MGTFDQLAAPPTFIIGHHRSGTTWAYELLTSHPEVAGILESWLFTQSAGIVPLFGPAHWSDEQQAHQLKTHHQLIGLGQLLTRGELVDEMRSLAEKWFSRKLAPHHRFLVEKTPSPYTDVPLVAELFPAARFLHVVRDGRDVAVSVRAAATTWNPGWNYAGAKGRLGQIRSFRNVGRSWGWTIRDLRALGRSLGDRYHEVRYEDLHSSSGAAIREMFDFASIPVDEGLLDAARETTAFTGRFAGGEDQFRRAGRTGDWQERFRTLDALAFERGSRGALAMTGYERDRLWWMRPGRRTQDARGGDRAGRS